MELMKELGPMIQVGVCFACLMTGSLSACTPAPQDEGETEGAEKESSKDDAGSSSPDGSKDSEVSEDSEGDDGEGKEEDSEGSSQDSSENDSGDADEGDAEPEKKAEVPDEFKDKKNPFEEDDKTALKAGEALYEEHCEGCHGKDGSGELPGMPDMSSEEAGQWPVDWTYWKVLKGSSEMMPAAEGVLSEEEIWQCITYVRSLVG